MLVPVSTSAKEKKKTKKKTRGEQKKKIGGQSTEKVRRWGDKNLFMDISIDMQRLCWLTCVHVKLRDHDGRVCSCKHHSAVGSRLKEGD